MADEWRAAFLDALARTGNVAAAARVAGVARSTADRARRRDAGFARGWARATRRAGTRVRAGQAGVIRGRNGAGGVQAGSGEAGLVFRASSAGNAGRGAQLVAASSRRWTPAAEARFFAVLEQTGSIRLACRAAGFSPRALFMRKAKDAAFAARWAEAVGRGRETLHLLVVGAATATFSGGGAGDAWIESGDGEEADGGDASDAAVPRMTAAEAIAVLKLGHDGTGRHRGRPARDFAGGGGRPFARTPELAEIKAGILRKLDAIRRARAGREEAGLGGAELGEAGLGEAGLGEAGQGELGRGEAGRAGMER